MPCFGMSIFFLVRRFSLICECLFGIPMFKIHVYHSSNAESLDVMKDYELCHRVSLARAVETSPREGRVAPVVADTPSLCAV